MSLAAHPPFAADIEVRFSDLDAYGHVNNATFFTYLEVARTKLFRAEFAEMMRNGLLFLVVRAECDYKRPIELTDQVVVEMEMRNFGRSSFEIGYRLHDGKDTLFASAATVMVCFDRREARTVPVPERLKQIWNSPNWNTPQN